MNDTFDTTPSPEYIAAKQAMEAARHQFRQTQERAVARGVLPINDPDFNRACEGLDAAVKSLNATPEKQFLDEIEAAEVAASDRFFNDELARRGRQITALYVETDFGKYETMDAALYQTGLCYKMTDPQRYTGMQLSIAQLAPITVVADMRRLSAAQLVGILRWMADQIDENGVPVYNRPAPSEKYCPDWWADEFPDGRLRHSCYRNSDPPAAPDER